MSNRKVALCSAAAVVSLIAFSAGAASAEPASPASVSTQPAPAAPPATASAQPAAPAPAAAASTQPAPPAQLAAASTQPAPPPARPAVAPPPGPRVLSEVVVTAQKREQNIQNVGMSIQAATGDQLTKLGVTNTEQLAKIVPGFQATPTYYGTNVYTIRGIGFQDTSLAGSPTVTVYLDEAPLPFASLTNGATLDLQRVEVLKGPQGTLFGNNATGGAINYIAAKPTDKFEAGIDASYGTFNNVDLMGFVSGPVAEGLDMRLALRHNESGPWQKGYGPQAGETIGGQDFTNGRFAVLWKPNDKLRALLTLNGWKDEGYNQMPQLFGIAKLSATAPLSPTIANYPVAPHSAEWAGWNRCVNVNPWDPIANQELGTTYGTPSFPGPLATPTGPRESQGPGSIVQAGGQPIDCVAPRKNNSFWSGTVRVDYSLTNDIVFTSLSQYLKFNRTSAIDGSGMPVQDYQSLQRGKIQSVYQEFRLSGKWPGSKGSWILGVNYENDESWDQFLQTYNASSASPTLFVNPNTAANVLGFNAFPITVGQVLPPGAPPECGVTGTLGPFGGVGCGTTNTALVLGPTKPTDMQFTHTLAGFISGEYPILDNLTILGGIRYTHQYHKGAVCGNDGGDGAWSQVAFTLQSFSGSTDPRASPPGHCASNGPPPTFNSPNQGLGSDNGLFVSHLHEHNLAWRAGVNWKVTPDDLLYVTISKGYKGGSFPTVALATAVQAHPVVQEALLSYEIGAKTRLLDRQLQLNAAMFYYDYTNKQILGAVADVLYGALPLLVNVPKSEVKGFEVSAVYTPNWLEGLTISPAISYQYSQVKTSGKNVCNPPPYQDPTLYSNDPAAPNFLPGVLTCIPGHYYGFDAFGQYADFTGQRFPSAPVWQASVDAEYDWKLRDDVTAFVGANLQYASSTNSFFYNRSPTPAYLNVGTGGTFPTFGGFVSGFNPDQTPILSPTPVGPMPLSQPNDPLRVPGYTLLDMRAGLTFSNWRVQLWARNVTNKWYWTSSLHVNDVLYRYTGMPRTIGVTVSYRYH